MIPAGVQVFVALEPVDMRFGFDRLSGMVRERMGYEPRCGALFVFVGRRRQMVKVLFADATGICVLSNQPSSHYTSFDPFRESCFFVRDVRCGGPVFKAIPSAAVLGRPIPRFLVEPGVPVVRMRFDDAVFDPARERGLVDPKTGGV